MQRAVTEEPPRVVFDAGLLSVAIDDDGKPDLAKLTETSDRLRGEMESLASKIREMTRSLPPVQLLAWVWAKYHMSIMTELRKKDNNYRPNKSAIGELQFELEYLHAIWSCEPDYDVKSAPLDEEKASVLMQSLKKLKELTLDFCFASSWAKHASGNDVYLTKLEFEAKSAWVIIRGHRYQVLEEEFFQYVLAPHTDALKKVYGMEANAIAAGIQAIANILRTGVSDAVQKLFKGMEQANLLMLGGSKDLKGAIAALKAADEKYEREMAGAIEDVFHGGICSMSRHSNFTATLLDDLSFCPGENIEFFADGDFKGTPLRTLPARIKPGIKLGDKYYFTDGQFVRDSAYRAIQRGLLARLPSYREDWKTRQQEVVEAAFSTVCAQQFIQATKYRSIFYRDVTTSEWVECDLVMIQDDVLFVVEAKAGAMPMHSTEISFERFERLIRELVLKAYIQCKRFLNYLGSAPEVKIFHLIGGKYVPSARLRLQDFRTILPIGLTVEAFTPFSAMAKAHPDIKPLLERHAFISMSVDDLFVLNRFLPSTGALIHYLQVRQLAAQYPTAMIFDEMDHLGAYIRRNRFDMDIKKHLKKYDMMLMDAFCDVVDEHFESRDWANSAVPCQEFPKEVATVLTALDEHRPIHWLFIDSLIRDQDGNTRKVMATTLANLWPTLQRQPSRHFLLGGDGPMEVWMCRSGAEPNMPEVQRSGQISCIIERQPHIAVLVLSLLPTGVTVSVTCHVVGAPTAVQRNYPELVAEANQRRTMIRPVNVEKRNETIPRLARRTKFRPREA
jgi:hypothetical protein